MSLLLDSIRSWPGAVLGFLIGLVPLIMLHEFGHLLMAKAVGVWAKEYGIGYPPRILKLFSWGETDFTLNWIPFGGFVRLEGEGYVETEEEEEELEATATKAEIEARRAKAKEAEKHSLYAKSPGQRTLIFLSGPLTNLLTAWLLAVLLFVTGVPAPMIYNVMPNSPAQNAGLAEGDVILSINDRMVESLEDVTIYTSETLGEQTEVTIQRDGETIEVSLVPRVDPPEGEGAMGIAITTSGEHLKHYGLGQAVVRGTQYVGTLVGMTIALPVFLIRGLIPVEQARPVGVVGISRIAQQSIEQSVATGAIFPILNILILISASLGIFNLLPIPALDGGRILFAALEKIRREPISPELEERIHLVAMALLLVLFVFITALDFIAPIPLP